MNYFKKFKWTIVSTLLAIGCGLIAAYFLHTPSHEITRAELSQAIQQHQVTKAQATPTPYAGIYFVDGTRTVDGQTEKFYVTTHLDENEVKALFASTPSRSKCPARDCAANG